MKRNTFNKKCIYALRLSVLFFLFLNTESVRAQVFQNDVLYISDNAVFYMDTDVTNYQFGAASVATSVSTRTNNVYGRLAFAEGVGSVAATDNHFFDGYVTTYSTNDFTFPVGQSSVYAPIRINVSNVNGVDAAYIHSDPSVFDSAFGGEISGLVSLGYWNVQRTSGSDANAKVTLLWDSSLSSLIGTEIEALVIAGYNGTGWVDIVVDPAVGTVASGSITSSADIDLSIFKYFTFGKRETCAPVIADNGVTTIWNGTGTGTIWSNGTPTAQSIAVLNANYSGNIIANSLNMGSYNVTLADGEVMEIVKGVVSTGGKVIMSSKASLVQRDDTAVAPPIELTKKTRDLKRYNYTYFGSPVEGDDVFSQLAGAFYLNPVDNNRLYNHYKWVAGNYLLFDTPYLSAWTALNSGNFVTTGNGWISSIKSQAPFNKDSFTGVVSLKFTGTANNGVYNVGVLKSSNADADPDHGSNYNLLANPYPSAISADKFLEENLNIDGTVYIWEAKTQPLSIETGETGYYNQSDYITYTKAGSTAPSLGSLVFKGNIASSQGFMVKALSSGNVLFNNCMRLSGLTDNDSFFRTSIDFNAAVMNNLSVDRFKLNLTSSTDHFNQVLIAYIPGLSMGYDRGYDASRNSTSGSQIFSIMGETNQRLAIDARPAFVNTDVVSIGFTTTSPISSTNFQISIVDKEGVFQDDNVDVFIHDKLNNVYHNFDNGVFNFTASQSELLNRFDVVYQSSTLNNQDFDEVNVMVSLSESSLFLSSKEVIDVAYIFDITGRLINKIKVNDFKYSGNFNHAQGVYIVRVELSNGQSVSNKVINK